MKTKRDYTLALDTIREVIHQWDAYGLLQTGAPLDEFDGEIASIATQLSRIHSSKDASHTLSRVFSSSFEPHLFKPEYCLEAGEQLYQALLERGLLQ